MDFAPIIYICVCDTIINTCGYMLCLYYFFWVNCEFVDAYLMHLKGELSSVEVENAQISNEIEDLRRTCVEGVSFYLLVWKSIYIFSHAENLFCCWFNVLYLQILVVWGARLKGCSAHWTSLPCRLVPHHLGILVIKIQKLPSAVRKKTRWNTWGWKYYS